MPMMPRNSRLGKGMSSGREDESRPKALSRLRAARSRRPVQVRIAKFRTVEFRAPQFRAGGDGFIAGRGERLGERLDLPLGGRGPGGRRRSQRLGPQPGRLGFGELRQDMSRINGGGLVRRRADQHRRLADKRIERHQRVLGARW
jgi:hypothetical protein